MISHAPIEMCQPGIEKGRLSGVMPYQIKWIQTTKSGMGCQRPPKVRPRRLMKELELFPICFGNPNPRFGFSKTTIQALQTHQIAELPAQKTGRMKRTSLIGMTWKNHEESLNKHTATSTSHVKTTGDKGRGNKIFLLESDSPCHLQTQLVRVWYINSKVSHHLYFFININQSGALFKMIWNLSPSHETTITWVYWWQSWTSIFVGIPPMI